MRYPKTSNYRQNPLGGGSGGANDATYMSGILTIRRLYYTILFIYYL